MHWINERCNKWVSHQTFVGLEDVLKPPSRNVLKTSSTRIHHNSCSILQFFVKVVTLKTSSKRFEDMPCRRYDKYLEDALKTFLEDVFKKSWRQMKYLLGISVSSKSKCVYLWSNKSISNKCISDKSKANQKCINYTQ